MAEDGAVIVGLGVDAVDVPRMRRVLERRPGLLDRLFTEGERAYARGHTEGVLHLAARYAAKEAVMKSLGVGLGSVAFAEIDIQTAPSGAPLLVLNGAAARLATERAVVRWHLSLTHTATTAIAVVVAEG
jgi:holo-[acyl-carrier protein] synthase